MTQTGTLGTPGIHRSALAGIAATSAALLMTELALTRIFSVTMFYHFAFLAISTALFGLSASGVLVYVLLQLLLGHPVYSLTVTLFSLLLGTGLGSLMSRRIGAGRVKQVTLRALGTVVLVVAVGPLLLPALIDLAIPWPLAARILVAGGVLAPLGILLGLPLPGGMRLLAATRPDIVPWGWGLNGAFSVVGATLAVFIAMNWGFSATLLIGALAYSAAAATLATR